MSEVVLMDAGEQRGSIWVLAAAVGLAMLITGGGCMVGPNYHPPQTTVPSAWVGVAKPLAGQVSMATAQPAELTQWWKQFNDPTLSALVEEAVKVNLDLKLAEARLRQARAARGVAFGGLWPAVTASGSYSESTR